MRSCHSISKIKQIQWSWMILLLLPITVFQHPQQNCIYTSNISQGGEQFQTPARCWSHTSVFPQKLVQNVKPTLNGIIVNDDRRFVIFFFTYSCVIMMLWWKEDESLVSCCLLSGHWYNHIQKNKPLFCFPLSNNAGTAGSLFLSMPITVIFLVKRRFASSQLVKKLSAVTPFLVPYIWQTISLVTWRTCFSLLHHSWQCILASCSHKDSLHQQ